MIEKKIIFITGACGKIGSAIVRGLNQSNNLILMDIDKMKLIDLSESLGDHNHMIFNGSSMEEKDIDKCIKSAMDKFGKIDVSIHAAYPKSKNWGTKFENLEFNSLGEDIKNQLGGAIIFSQRIINLYLNQGFGSLIHISSIQGTSAPKFDHYKNTTMTSPIEYSAIKSGIIAIVRYLAKYYKNKNIRVNCISPGGIKDQQPNIFLQNYRNNCNLKGMLDAEDLLGLVNFLISEDSKYINGQNIIIDDGWSL